MVFLLFSFFAYHSNDELLIFLFDYYDAHKCTFFHLFTFFDPLIPCSPFALCLIHTDFYCVWFLSKCYVVNPDIVEYFTFVHIYGRFIENGDKELLFSFAFKSQDGDSDEGHLL